jgi:hypothetical protein
MLNSTATRMEETACATGVAHARAVVVVPSNLSIVRRLFASTWSESSNSRKSDWLRVGSLAVGGDPEPQILRLNSDGVYRLVKLRATLVDVYIPHFTLEFGGGSLQNFSVGRLLRGCESRPVDLAGREWEGISVEYLVRAGERGNIEVWAKP